MEFTERLFDTGVVTLNYAEGPGAGLPLVLLHGGNGRWQFFSGIMLELAERWHLCVPDLRGQGGRDGLWGFWRVLRGDDGRVDKLAQPRLSVCGAMAG